MLKAEYRRQAAQCRFFLFVSFTFMTWFSQRSNIMKVHKAILFMTWYSYAQSWVPSTSYTMSHLPVRVVHIHDLIFPFGWILWKYTRSLCLWCDIPMLKAEFCNKLQNVASSCSGHSRLWLDFPIGLNIMKVRKVTLFISWYSYAKSWVPSTSCIVSLLPVRVVHVHNLIFPTCLILRKYTSSLCLWTEIPMLKAEFRLQATQCCIFQFVPFTFVTWFSHRV